MVTFSNVHLGRGLTIFTPLGGSAICDSFGLRWLDDKKAHYDWCANQAWHGCHDERDEGPQEHAEGLLGA